MTNLGVFRVSQPDRKEFEEENPLWKDAHQLIDNIIDAEIEEIRVVVSQYLLLAYKMLSSTNSLQEAKEMLVFFENMQPLIVLLPGYNEMFSDTQEEELLFSLDPYHVTDTSDLRFLTKSLDHYADSLDT